MMVVLASASPRRRELLAALGVPFETLPSEVEEPPFKLGEDPGAFAERLALEKALSVRQPGSIVIGADTLVYLDGESLAKPGDATEAREMLQRLRNREHLVITGLAVVNETQQTCHVTTRVRMRDYTDDEIDTYVASGDPLDKAGAYAIQNVAFHPVASIVGCYQNVVGLPLCALVKMLRRTGVGLPPIPEKLFPRECCACEERTMECAGLPAL
ncbi:MAG: septum formation protein Maf [Chloroflexi bacterium]|nr:septum formation protein Maf [Chloroflexota bacterium]